MATTPLYILAAILSLLSCRVRKDPKAQLNVAGGSIEQGEPRLFLLVLTTAEGASGFCTGYALNKRMILTAGHCGVELETGKLMKVQVVYNIEDLRSTREPSEKNAIDVEHFKFHPNFLLKNAEDKFYIDPRFDIALATTKYDLPTELGPLPPLLNSAPTPMATAKVMGFGLNRVFDHPCYLDIEDGHCEAHISDDPVIKWKIAEMPCTRASFIKYIDKSKIDKNRLRTLCPGDTGSDFYIRPETTDFLYGEVLFKRSGETVLEGEVPKDDILIGSYSGMWRTIGSIPAKQVIDAKFKQPGLGSGDSGGPFFVKQESQWVLAGVASSHYESKFFVRTVPAGYPKITDNFFVNFLYSDIATWLKTTQAQLGSAIRP